MGSAGFQHREHIMSGTEQDTMDGGNAETPGTEAQTLSGAEILIRALTDQGFEVIFG